MKEKVVITGGTGFLARHLKKHLVLKGYHIVTLTTKPSKQTKNIFFWDFNKKEIDPLALKNCQHIIHLAGFSLSNKWNKKNKLKMIESRIETSRFILKTCKKYPSLPR